MKSFVTFIQAKIFLEQTIQKVDKLGFFEIKNFCPSNDTVKEMKRQTTDWKKIFAKCIADR